MSNRLTKHKNLYDKLMIKDNAIPETREEAFDLALILTLKGESYTGIVSDSKWNSSKHAQLLTQIMDGDNIVPETRDEAVKLAIIRNHHDNVGGGSVNLSNYYKKSQTYSNTEINALLNNYYKKTETYSEAQILAALSDKATKSYVNEMFAKMDGLTRKIVTSVPTPDESDEKTIYMLKVTDEDGNDIYEMYMKIEGEVVLIGNTKIDLSGYTKISETEKKSYDNAASLAHKHGNLDILNMLSQDIHGNLIFNGSTISGSSGSAGNVDISQNTFENVAANDIKYININGGSLGDKFIGQAYKFIPGESNIVETLKSFNNDDASNFNFNDEIVEFTNNGMGIKDTYKLKRTKYNDELYITEAFNKDDFVDINTINI